MIGCSSFSLEQGWRREAGGTRQTPGLPDICVFGPERCPFMGWIEVKAGKGKLRPSQIIFQKLCEKNQVPHVVAYSVGDVFGWLHEHGVIETAK